MSYARKSPSGSDRDASRTAQARPALAAAGVRPTRSRGQNFLVQVAIANRIVDAAALSANDQVIEIGPGLGILSERIAAHPVARVTMVELEAKLAARLEERFAGDRRVRVVNRDFLDLEFASLFDTPPVKVIGNLPFNVAAAILRRLCDHSREIALMVLMFQREVAERIRAHPGDDSYGAISVFTSLYFKIESHFRVGAGNFHPRPKVDAEVLVFRPHAELPFAPAEETRVLRTVRAAFSAPRKTLRNALGRALAIGPDKIASALHRAGIDPGARAETLAPADLLRLAYELGPDLITHDA